MKRGSLHTRSFRRVHFSVFRYGWSKNGFTGSKSFRSFRETGPRRRMWVEFVVRSLLCSETGFSPGTPVIPSPQKPTFLNSTLLWTPASGDCANTPCVWHKIHIYILLLQCFSLNLFPTQILQEVENICRLAFPFFPSCSMFTLFLVHSVGLLVNAYGPLLTHSCPLCGWHVGWLAVSITWMFSGIGLLTLCPTPNLEVQLVWDWSFPSSRRTAFQS